MRILNYIEITLRFWRFYYTIPTRLEEFVKLVVLVADSPTSSSFKKPDMRREEMDEKRREGSKVTHVSPYSYS